jgi:hypothetical protein
MMAPVSPFFCRLVLSKRSYQKKNANVHFNDCPNVPMCALLIKSLKNDGLHNDVLLILEKKRTTESPATYQRILLPVLNPHFVKAQAVESLHYQK